MSITKTIMEPHLFQVVQLERPVTSHLSLHGVGVEQPGGAALKRAWRKTTKGHVNIDIRKIEGQMRT